MVFFIPGHPLFIGIVQQTAVVNPGHPLFPSIRDTHCFRRKLKRVLIWQSFVGVSWARWFRLWAVI